MYVQHKTCKFTLIELLLSNIMIWSSCYFRGRDGGALVNIYRNLFPVVIVYNKF